MEDLISFWVPVALVPILLAHGVAYVLARVLSVRFDRIHDRLKVIVAGIMPTFAVIGYFWIWQKIDFAQHQAERGVEGYMGPMVLLVFGWPMLLAVTIASFFFAAHIFYSRKNYSAK